MKDFIVLGPTYALYYRDIFKGFKEGIVSGGINAPSFFFGKEGERIPQKGVCHWYNTAGVRRTKETVLTKSYWENPEAYPKYDGFDAINVDRTKDIPYDYNGLIGVPCTFLLEWFPEFEVIMNLGGCKEEEGLIGDVQTVNGKKKFVRIVIRRRK